MATCRRGPPNGASNAGEKMAIAPPAVPGGDRLPNSFWCNSKPKFQISEFYRTAADANATYL